MNDARDDDRPADPGSYARYRQIIDDPTTRDALLLQVRGTVGGLRGAYRWHMILALLGIVAVLYAPKDALPTSLRWVVSVGAAVLDVLAFLGLRTVARAPARWLLPLLGADLLLAIGIPALAAALGTFHAAWLLLLVLPVMLLVYVRDARILTPLLAEHHAYRRQQAAGAPRP